MTFKKLFPRSLRFYENFFTLSIDFTAILPVTLIGWTVALVLTQIPKIPGGASCITVQAISTKWTL